MAKLAVGDYDLQTPEGRLHYTVVGKGPACITLSGGPGLDSRYFGDLGGIGDTVTLVHLHPRGSGLSQHPDESDWSLTAFARDVETLRRHLGLDLPFLLGHSHGGMIAQQYASDYPDALGGLLLIDTSPTFAGWNPEETTHRYANEPWYPEALAAMNREATTEEGAKSDLDTIMPFYFAHAGSQMEALRELIAPYRMNPAPGKQFDFQSLDLRPQLGGIRARTLVVVGEQDWICTVSMAEVLTTSIPNAQLVVFQDCGHFPWLEAQEPFHAAIQKFVKASPRTGNRGFWGMFRRRA